MVDVRQGARRKGCRCGRRTLLGGSGGKIGIRRPIHGKWSHLIFRHLILYGNCLAIVSETRYVIISFSAKDPSPCVRVEITTVRFIHQEVKDPEANSFLNRPSWEFFGSLRGQVHKYYLTRKEIFDYVAWHNLIN